MCIHSCSPGPAGLLWIVSCSEQALVSCVDHVANYSLGSTVKPETLAKGNFDESLLHKPLTK